MLMFIPVYFLSGTLRDALSPLLATRLAADFLAAIVGRWRSAAQIGRAAFNNDVT
jgi:hypothetical protein